MALVLLYAVLVVAGALAVVAWFARAMTRSSAYWLGTRVTAARRARRRKQTMW